MQIETVRIVSPVSDGNPNGYIVINAEDRTDEHELYVEPSDEDAAAKATAEAAALASAKAEADAAALAAAQAEAAAKAKK